MKSDNFVADIKILFDYIRNIGLCVAIILGVPYVESLIPFFSAKVIFAAFSVGVVFGLYVLNYMWLRSALKTEPTSKFFHSFGILTLIIVFTMTLGGASIYNLFSKSQAFSWVY
ncbi:hypothetical protein [Gilvimarinus japonicus]|uniref:Uncharacterized protein n=1 Tax=Gilvimarinus japonicus TaxID=1796469 RepID=A0ABV7HPM6_9GAMM